MIPAKYRVSFLQWSRYNSDLIEATVTFAAYNEYVTIGCFVAMID